jgi:hypothetical protein
VALNLINELEVESMLEEMRTAHQVGDAALAQANEQLGRLKQEGTDRASH